MMTFVGIGETLAVGDLDYVWTPGNITGNAISVTPASTTTYTVTATDPVSGCGTSESIEVVVNPLPSGVTGSTPSTQCGVGVPELFVTGGLPGTYNWYLTSTGGTAIAGENDASLSAYSIEETTTFYVAIFDGTCESLRTAVTATVNVPDIVNISGPSNSCAKSEVTLTAVQSGTNQNYDTFIWTASPEAGSGFSGPITECFIYTNSCGYILLYCYSN